MKRTVKILVLSCAISLGWLMTACGSKEGTYYKKTTESKSESSLADKQSTEEALIEEGHDNKVTLTVFTAQDNGMKEAALNVLQSRLLNLVASNGLGCVGGDPCFALVAKVNKINETLTNTQPQKYTTTYMINYYVGNIITGEVYGSCISEVVGVGQSKEKAEMNALRNIKNSRDVESMLKNANSKIINWYSTDSIAFFSRVLEFQKQGKLDLAVCMLKNVPSQAAGVYDRAHQMLPDLVELAAKQRSQEALNQIKGLAHNKTVYNPEIMAWYKSIPADSPLKSEADAVINSYISGLDQNIQDQIAQEYYKEREELAIKKLQAQLNIRANEELLSVYREQYYNQPSGSPVAADGTSSGFVSLLTNKAINVGFDLLLSYIF